MFLYGRFIYREFTIENDVDVFLKAESCRFWSVGRHLHAVKMPPFSHGRGKCYYSFRIRNHACVGAPGYRFCSRLISAEMLRFAGWSFAMENGHPDVKRIARYLARSNNENGVLRAVRKYALGENAE